MSASNSQPILSQADTDDYGIPQQPTASSSRHGSSRSSLEGIAPGKARSTAYANTEGAMDHSRASSSSLSLGPKGKTRHEAADRSQRMPAEDYELEPTYTRQSASAPLLGPSDEHDFDRIRSSLEEEQAALRTEQGENPLDAARGTMLAGVMNMANSIIGAGIIGLPFAISEAGFWTGTLLLIALAGVTDWTIRLIVLNAKLSGRDSYIEIMGHCFGMPGRAAVSFFQFMFAYGGMCAFGVIICDSIPPVIAYVFPFLAEHSYTRFLIHRNFVIGVCTICVSFPLSLHRDIAKLSRASGFALVSMLIIVFSVVVRGVSAPPELRGTSEDVFAVMKPRVFEAIGVISFAFVCHHNTLLIYGSLHTPTLDRFNAVTHASTGMSLVLCLVMSLTGYLVFTDKTEGNILNNFPASDLLINIARFCFGCNMTSTLPLEAFVCREVIETFLYGEKEFSQRRHVIVTSAICFTTMAISMMTCDLGVVLEIVGGLSATALAFVFPAAAFLALTAGPWYGRAKLPAVICAAFGCIVLVCSVGLTIAKTWNGEGGSGKVCT